jgi:hypothetical protein
LWVLKVSAEGRVIEEVKEVEVQTEVLGKKVKQKVFLRWIIFKIK